MRTIVDGLAACFGTSDAFAEAAIDRSITNAKDSNRTRVFIFPPEHRRDLAGDVAQLALNSARLEC